MKASDSDMFCNRQISYQLLNNPNNIFAIRNRGFVIINKPSLINQQKLANFSLVVKATDNGNPKLSSTTKLQIIVLSASDTPPQFEKLSYLFSIEENNLIDSKFGELTVKTTENLKNKVVLTKILNGPTSIFKLDNKGVLTVSIIFSLYPSSHY